MRQAPTQSLVLFFLLLEQAFSTFCKQALRLRACNVPGGPRTPTHNISIAEKQSDRTQQPCLGSRTHCIAHTCSMQQAHIPEHAAAPTCSMQSRQTFQNTLHRPHMKYAAGARGLLCAELILYSGTICCAGLAHTQHFFIAVRPQQYLLDAGNAGQYACMHTQCVTKEPCLLRACMQYYCCVPATSMHTTVALHGR